MGRLAPATPDDLTDARRVGLDWMEDYVSRYGLHVVHAFRHGAEPDIAAWVQAYHGYTGGRYYVSDDGTGHLWLWWKEEKK